MKGMKDKSKGGGQGGMGPHSGAKSRTSDGTKKGFQGGPAGEVAKGSRSRPLSGAKNIGWK